MSEIFAAVGRCCLVLVMLPFVVVGLVAAFFVRGYQAGGRVLDEWCEWL